MKLTTERLDKEAKDAIKYIKPERTAGTGVAL